MFDPKVVSVWLGYSESISAKHCAQARPEDFAAAASKPVAPQPRETGQTGVESGSDTDENGNKKRMASQDCVAMRSDGVLRVGIQQREKQGENLDLLEGGAPGGATWGEIRGLIARCEDLPEDVRGQLVALGDRSRVGLNKDRQTTLGSV